MTQKKIIISELFVKLNNTQNIYIINQTQKSRKKHKIYKKKLTVY